MVDPPPQPGRPSGLFHAGRILLLVGAILHAVSAVTFVALGLFFLVAFGEAPAAVVAFFPALYVVLGVLSGVGAVFGFLAQGAANRGDARKAWVQGLVASLLPPVQLITLAGAILCLVSPEGEAAKRGPFA